MTARYRYPMRSRSEHRVHVSARLDQLAVLLGELASDTATAHD